MAATHGLGSNLSPETDKKVPPVGMPETVRIVLEENDNIPSNGLYLGHNGSGYLLRPGMEANVPVGLIDILDHAVESRPVIDPITRQPTGWRDRMRYPYRRVAVAA